MLEIPSNNEISLILFLLLYSIVKFIKITRSLIGLQNNLRVCVCVCTKNCILLNSIKMLFLFNLRRMLDKNANFCFTQFFSLDFLNYSSS